MAAQSNVRKVRLTRHLLMNGEHAEKGSVFSVPRNLAAALIGEGSAVPHADEGEQPETGATTVDRMERPGNADPAPQKLRGPEPRVKGRKSDRTE
jgi:hypothetical protein